MAQVNPFDSMVPQGIDAVEPNPFDAMVPGTPPARNEEEEEFSSGEWTLLDNLTGASLFIEGATLGWSDEALVGLQSLVESVGSDKELAEIYAENKDAYDAVIKDFRRRNPNVALTAEVVGAIVSPISKLKGIEAAGSLGGLVARGAGEGALASLGAAERGADMTSAAAEGALLGGVTTGALGSLGWLFKRRVEAPLETEEGFTPITLAAKKDGGLTSSEALLQSFYKGVVGPSFGGGALRAQEEVIVGPLKTRSKELTQVLEAAKSEAGAAKAQLSDSVKKIDRTARTIKADSTEAQEIIKGNYNPFLGNDGPVMVNSVQKAKEVTERAQDAFRLVALENSLPARMPKRKIKDITEATSPNSAMKELELNWTQHGFEASKGRSFIVKPQELINNMAKRATARDLALLAGNENQVVKEITAAAELVAERVNKKTSRMSGVDLTNLRSNLGMKAAALSGDDGQSILRSAVYREMQNSIDDVITSQLKGKRLADYLADKKAYKSQSVLRDAVLAASGKAGRQGRFTPDEWVAAIKKNNKKEARIGEGPLRQEAEKTASFVKTTTDKITSEAELLATKLANRRDRELKRAVNKAKAELSSLDKQKEALEKRLSKDPEAMSTISENMKRQEQVRQELSVNEQEIAKLNALRTAENPSWFWQLAATGIISGLTSLPTGLTAAAAGIGTAKALTTPTAQKALAGQLPTQQAVQQMQFLGSDALGTAPLAGSRAVTGMLTGQE